MDGTVQGLEVEAAALTVAAIGLEAGPLSQWLHKGLTDAGFETVLMETRQVKAAPSMEQVIIIGIDLAKNSFQLSWSAVRPWRPAWSLASRWLTRSTTL